MKKQVLIPAVLILVALGSLGWWHWGLQAPQEELVASGTLEATTIDLAAKVTGRIERIAVHEGQDLPAGAELLHLDLRDLQAQDQQVKAQKKAAQARLALLKAGSRSEDLRSAQAALAAAEWRVKELHNGSRQAEKEQVAAEVASRQSQFKLAEQEWNRVQALFAAETVPQQKVDQAKQALDTAHAALVVAQKNRELVLQGARQEDLAMAQQQAEQQRAMLQKLQHGVRPQEIQEASAMVEQTQAQDQEIQLLLAEQSLKSPCACRVSVLGVEAGELISAGTPMVTLLDPQDLWVKVYLSPLELKYVRLHQAVELTVDAYPDQRFHGEVVHIASKAEYTPRNIQTREERIHQVFAVKVAVKAAQDRLFAGMPVDVIWPQAQTESQAETSGGAS